MLQPRAFCLLSLVMGGSSGPTQQFWIQECSPLSVTHLLGLSPVAALSEPLFHSSDWRQEGREREKPEGTQSKNTRMRGLPSGSAVRSQPAVQETRVRSQPASAGDPGKESAG